MFKIRESYWSDGTSISAEDFEYAWKKILDPGFKTAFAYLFYPIKNAQAAKEGLIPSKKIGIKAFDQRTLIVDLEHPTPYFLELTAHAFYSPINHILDKTHPNWSSQEGSTYVCNGPFCVKKVQADQNYEFIRNERYWDAKEVKLERILISKTNPHTALEMYQKGEIDWLGRPISPWEPFFADQTPELVKSGPPGFVYWCVLNTERFPFSHAKFRQALGLALNRKEIIQSLAYPVLPATAPLPMAYSQFANKKALEEDRALAERLFAEALQELKLKKEDLPVFTFLHMTREARKKVAEAIVRQWKEVFGIECRLENCEWSTLFSKLTYGDFQIGEMSWFSPINDPHYTLDAFKHRTNSVNFAKWENVDFQYLLNAAASELNSKDRLEYLALAEKILMEQMPIIPIFYDTDSYKRKSYLQEVYQRTEQVDFKWAYIARDLSSQSFHALNLASSKKFNTQRRTYESKIISITEKSSNRKEG
jgi:oligopeptide transport system substrate-binding protein